MCCMCECDMSCQESICCVYCVLWHIYTWVITPRTPWTHRHLGILGRPGQEVDFSSWGLCLPIINTSNINQLRLWHVSNACLEEIFFSSFTCPVHRCLQYVQILVEWSWQSHFKVAEHVQPQCSVSPGYWCGCVKYKWPYWQVGVSPLVSRSGPGDQCVASWPAWEHPHMPPLLSSQHQLCNSLVQQCL